MCEGVGGGSCLHSWRWPTWYLATMVDDRRTSALDRLTLFYAWCDSNEGHEAAESQVDPQQDLVELAGDGVCVVLIHEGEGHRGDSVKEKGGAHHRQIPPFIFCCSSKPKSRTEYG